jgi:hypothetical protein
VGAVSDRPFVPGAVRVIQPDDGDGLSLAFLPATPVEQVQFLERPADRDAGEVGVMVRVLPRGLSLLAPVEPAASLNPEWKPVIVPHTNEILERAIGALRRDKPLAQKTAEVEHLRLGGGPGQVVRLRRRVVPAGKPSRHLDEEEGNTKVRFHG